MESSRSVISRRPLSKALVMDDLPLAQEDDRVADIGIVNQAQDVVVGGAGLLLGREILRQVGDRIPLGLEVCSGKGIPAAEAGYTAVV